MSEPDAGGDLLACQWCGIAAPPEATRCPGCGAALARRESIGDLVIPGVTGVDPALAALDGQPLRIPRASPSQGMAGGAVMAAAMGGPVGLAALGALGAVAATEYMLAGGAEAEKARLEAVGRPNELALQMLEKLEKEEADPGSADPWRDVRMSSEGGTDPAPESAPDATPAADRADEVGRGRHPGEDEHPTE